MAIERPSRADHNFISIEREDGVRIGLKLESHRGLDKEGDEPVATVRITADLKKEPADIGIDSDKDRMLVGETIGKDPAPDSVLGMLKTALNKRFNNRVHADMPDSSTVMGLRADRGEKVYDITLYPMPEGVDASRFEKAVRDTLKQIKHELQPTERDASQH